VTIELATDAALRGAAALRSLVEAVVGAAEHDEADWIEWKGRLDLATKEGCFHVARAVLGMANREPDRAQLVVEGMGYVVVGAEPGTLHGLATVDPAKLGQLIEPYLGGADGPAWTPTYVPIDTATVLVVAVEAPKPGDPIRLLRRQLDKYREGSVFVRKHGRTDLADAADMEALQRRLLDAGGRRGANLAVGIVGDVPLSWFDPASLPTLVEQWADGEQQQLVGAAREVDRRRQEARAKAARDAGATSGILGGIVLPPAFFEQMSGMSALGGFTLKDQRVLDEYEEEVAEWRKELVDAAPKCLPGRYVRAGHGVIQLEVENLGSRFLPDVEVEATFGDETAQGFHERPEWRDYPEKPHAFGEDRMRHDFASVLNPPRFVPPVLPSVGSIGRRTWVEDGSVKVRWHVGDLRQHGKDQSEEVYVFLSARPPDGALHGTWKATVPDIEGVLTGTFDLPVADAPVDLGALLRARKRR
jgi:hypothetical protein